MKKRAKSTEFACYVRNYTENALGPKAWFSRARPWVAVAPGPHDHAAVLAPVKDASRRLRRWALPIPDLRCAWQQ
jgi:hypothetical protein